MASALDPDVVLMDVRMPGRDGIEATRDIAAAGLRSKVLILTTFDLDDHVYAGLRAGASGFLLKETRALTAREQDVFALIAAGMSNSEIAARMHLSAAP